MNGIYLKDSDCPDWPSAQIDDRHYVLEGHTPVLVPDIVTWARAFGKSDRHVCKDTIGDVEISTVFLGRDLSFGDGPLLLFETMIFGGELDESQWRYATWDEAETGHASAVEKVKAAKQRREKGG